MNENILIAVMPRFIITFFLSCMIILPSFSRENLVNGNQVIFLDNNSGFTRLGAENNQILKRYLLGNYRWDYRKERGQYYAVLRHSDNRHKYTDLYGYVSYKQHEEKEIYTKVTITFDTYLGYPNLDMMSFINASEKRIKLKYKEDYIQSGILISYLIVKSNEIFIEIYERTDDPERNTTKKILEELNQEFTLAIDGRKEIEKNGVLNNSTFYPGDYSNHFFKIEQGEEPGIYLLSAALVINEPCEIFVRVYYMKTGIELSPNVVRSMSLREIGWSANADKYFHYNSEIKIFEGEYSRPYPVRVELWSRSSEGITKKLAAKSALVNGWNRKGQR